MRLIPYNRQEHKCSNCFVWNTDGKKIAGMVQGTCQLHPAHVQFVTVPKFDVKGTMVGMGIERVTGFPVLSENDTCYDHVPFPT